MRLVELSWRGAGAEGIRTGVVSPTLCRGLQSTYAYGVSTPKLSHPRLRLCLPSLSFVVLKTCQHMTERYH